MKIANIKARQILDSRGNPTVEADVILENGILGRAAVPSGASTGSNEAIELRDNDPKKFLGKSVLQAVENVNTKIKNHLVGKSVFDQKEIDMAMIDLDQTPNKAQLGANAILAVSLGAAHAAAKAKQLPLYAYVQSLSPRNPSPLLPLPMMNIINGGKHAAFATDIQEFMILPIGAPTFTEALRMGSEIFLTLGKVLHDSGYETTVGDEGGYGPRLKSGNTEALELISIAVEKAGYSLGKEIVLGLDVAATELFTNGKYNLNSDKKELTSSEMVEWLTALVSQYPVVSIEDGLSENDWDSWKELTSKIGQKVQLVGDDLLVTNTRFLKKGIEEKAGNAILIKPNQIGTLTETIEAITMAQEAGWKTVMSHRSGETEDTTIAHLAVGLATGQIKTGSLSRTDRVAKYNELLRIEELLGDKAQFASHIFKK